MSERPLSELSYRELLDEIKREEDILAELLVSLEGTNTQIGELKKALQEERTLIDIDRHRGRAERIRRLEEEIETKREQLKRIRADIEARAKRIKEYETSITVHLRRSRDPYTSITNREVARNVAITLERSISSLKGWQTRKRKLEDTLRDELKQLGRILGGYRRWQIKEEDQATRITELEKSLTFWAKTREDIKTDIKAEQDHLKLKYKELAKHRQLVRIKIRLYNLMEGSYGSPVGMFQTFWEIDAVLDPDTGLPDTEWHLTIEEVEICKYHMVGYFKGMAKWASPSEMGQAFFDDSGGIVAPEEAATYLRKKSGEPYTKRVSEEFVRRAERMTVRNLITGISSAAPKPVDEPEGCLFERAMVIDAEGRIKWDEIRNKWAWRPTREKIEEIKEELNIG